MTYTSDAAAGESIDTTTVLPSLLKEAPWSVRRLLNCEYAPLVMSYAKASLYARLPATKTMRLPSAVHCGAPIPVSNAGDDTSLIVLAATSYSISRDCSTTPAAVPSAMGPLVLGWDVHEISAPSVDHRGELSLPKFVLIFSTCFVATVATNTSRRLSRSIGVAEAPNTNRVPSGDQDGAAPSVKLVPSVMRVDCFVATSTTHACAKRKSPSNTRSSSRFLVLASWSAPRGSRTT